MDRDPSEIPIQYIKGVGPQRARLLGRLKISTVRDALYYLPYRYEDRRNIKKIHELTCGAMETAVGRIISMDVVRLPRSRFAIFELVISDGTGLLKGKWFNQPFMKRLFTVGQELILSGIVKQNPYRGRGFEIDKPEYEFLDDDAENMVHTSRIVPIYRTTAGLSLRVLRSLLYHILNTCLEKMVDSLPEEIRSRNSLPGLRESILNGHFPQADTDMDELNRGVTAFHRRLSFDEFFHLEIGIAIIKRGESRLPGIAFTAGGPLTEKLMKRLPFELTAAQQRVFQEILYDMKQPFPMNRLLQGDVGCGKTIVALLTMLRAVECGCQAALMAPTEILAEQHYINIQRLLKDLGLRITLLTGGKKEKPGEPGSEERDLVIGTHALIQEGVQFRKLGLIVIDEQHRFGVLQRAALRKKAHNPHVLVMTATPIPRTLAMTIYGDLDYSVIDELPPNRNPVITRLFTSGQKPLIYEAISSEVKKGRQIYVVYPMIEESENSDLKSAIAGKTALEKIFPDFRTAIIHGKMKTAEREAVMAAFQGRGINILVSTTVIEVGVDVPNATMMLVVHAERFGLSQLHQLRGRVGRGAGQSYCFLLAYEPYGDDARRRLGVMTKSNDGFRIAEEDLDIRGPGEFFGTKQSGVPDLKNANIARDVQLLEAARKEAFTLVGTDPEFRNEPHLKKTVEKFWAGKVEIFKTG
ncbi:MAG TPA: ATP-dependent DNA helicase RecG [Thermodesulfovibrionales bacterium]|nr:ATP-dependent DNA helicase RecG [Thermodesulfovibrionales bacterium]